MRVLKVFLPLVVLWSASAQTLQFVRVSPEIIEQRLRAYSPKNSGREAAVRRLFEDAGCTGASLSEMPVKGLKDPNLICTQSGATESVILVGAHFDFIEAGSGVVDNWSGAALLASFYQGLAATPRQHTYRFVAFSGEEKGLVGSRAYVKGLEKTHENIAAMINLDTLGLAETEVWLSRADPALAKAMNTAAFTMQLPVSAVNVEKVGSTDSEPFRQEKIPSITIHSLTQSTITLLHSPKDRIEAIHLDEYYRTYHLTLAYLALLDHELQ
jgi:hypothetical protein